MCPTSGRPWKFMARNSPPRSVATGRNSTSEQEELVEGDGEGGGGEGKGEEEEEEEDLYLTLCTGHFTILIIQ